MGQHGRLKRLSVSDPSVRKFRLGQVASLLGRVRETAERFHRAEQDLAAARDELRAAMAAAREEGVPIARLAREAGVSRPTAHEWLKQRSGE
jgi:hypothetical protein